MRPGAKSRRQARSPPRTGAPSGAPCWPARHRPAPPNSCSRTCSSATKLPRAPETNALKGAIVAADYRKQDPPPGQAGLFLPRQVLPGIREFGGNQETIAPPAQSRKGFAMTGQAGTKAGGLPPNAANRRDPGFSACVSKNGQRQKPQDHDDARRRDEKQLRETFPSLPMPGDFAFGVPSHFPSDFRIWRDVYNQIPANREPWRRRDSKVSPWTGLPLELQQGARRPASDFPDAPRRIIPRLAQPAADARTRRRAGAGFANPLQQRSFAIPG